MSILIVHLRSSGEGLGRSCPSTRFLNALDHEQVIPVLPDYPSDVGIRLGRLGWRQMARAAVLRVIAGSPRQVIVSGAGMGAGVAAAVARELAGDPRLLGCVLLRPAPAVFRHPLECLVWTHSRPGRLAQILNAALPELVSQEVGA